MHRNRGKGEMCLSFLAKHSGVKTQLGQLCGRQEPPQHCGTGSHFSASYLPKSVKVENFLHESVSLYGSQVRPKQN